MTEQTAVMNGGYNHLMKGKPPQIPPEDLTNGINHTQRKRLLYTKPQISVEDADFPSPPSQSSPQSSFSSPFSPLSPLSTSILPQLSCPNTPKGTRDPLLRVALEKSKTNSLPPGMTMNEPTSSCDATQDSDSSDGSQSADQPSLPTNTKKDTKNVNRWNSLDSEYYLVNASSSDNSSDMESVSVSQRNGFHSSRDSGEHDDDVFHEVEIDMCTEADSKLVDWAYNVFVPACRTLLHHCAEEKTELSVIQSHLRNLSNSIGYFCTEQQKMSNLLSLNRGITMSISTDRFARFSTLAVRGSSTNSNNNNGPSFSTKLSSSSILSTASSGFESQVCQADRSYAVKVLRSVSQLLIAPLLQQAETGFTQELYKAIVTAVQKISWKVEACLSFNNSGTEFEIHTEIFDEEQILKVREMMMKALPPEEPKLKSAALGSRSNSMSNKSLQKMSEAVPPAMTVETPEGYVPVTGRRTPSLKRRPSGQVFDPENLPRDLTSIVPKDKMEDGTLTDHFDSSADGSTSRRLRTSTTGDIMMSPRKVSKVNSSSQFGGEENPEDSIDYFRPRAYRRTTISLSRREVTRLGLTVAKRIDESVLNEMHAKANTGPPSPIPIEPKSGTQSPENNPEEEEDNEGEEMHSQETATKEFDRTRRASTSDLLDRDEQSEHGSKSEAPFIERRRRANSSDNVLAEPRRDSATGRASPTLHNLQKSFIFSKKRCQSEAFATGPADEWALVDDTKGKRKGKKSKKAAKKPVSKSLSASGRFTQSLMKTARALRNTSKSSKVEVITKSYSSDEILDTDTKAGREKDIGPRPSSALSGSMALSSKKGEDSKSGTLPVHKSRVGSTLARFVRRSREKPTSKSLNKKGSFEGWAPHLDLPGAGSSMFTESIENYSKNAVCSVQLEGDEQLLVSVDVAGKMPKTQWKRASAIISKDSSNVWFEITVTTNMKQFGRHHYTILRPFKQLQQLYDSLATSHFSHACQLPERPDKKIVVKKQTQQAEELLRSIAGNPDLRTFPPFISFLMPDDSFGSFSENDSEVSFDLLMTFYTPDIYSGPSGPPGSNQGVRVVTSEDVPTTSPPGQYRKQTSLQHKRGSLHLMKKDGKEDPSTFVIREEGCDALIVAYEDERYVVVAGTFKKLVEQLACEEKPDPRFVTTLLLGYRHFASPMDLLTILLRRFHMTVPPNATEEEIAYAEKWTYVIQLRVLDILSYWIKKCWPDFYRNSPVLDKMREFIKFLKHSEDTNFHLAGTNLEKIIKEKEATSVQYTLPSTDQLDSPHRAVATPPAVTASTSVTTPTTVTTPTAINCTSAIHLPVKRLSSTCDISTLTAIQLARQLTLIELELLQAIDAHELAVYIWEHNSPANKPYRRNVDAVIARFNKVSYWVASEICSVENTKQRGALIEKFIDVAKHCHEYKNFNSTISVVSGLALAAVRRLKRSWEHVSERSTKAFQKLSQLMSPTNNHMNYRRTLASVHRRDAIPYFGVFIRDLTFFNDGNQKTLRNGLLNFSKLRTMVLKFEEMKRYQRAKYFFPPEDKTREFCRNLWCFSEHELYDRSEAIEPRDPPPTDSPDSSTS